MIDTGSNGSGGRVKPEVVISTLKDDGDFDRLRRKTIRKLKDDEELRSNIISMVKQSAALSRPGVESMKPRQLSDAIHQEIGDKLMNQISDGLWNIIKSADGMQSEIKETVRSVYDKLSNPGGKDNGESSSRKDSSPGNKLESRDAAGAFAASDTLSDEDLNEPIGFALRRKKKKNQMNNVDRPNRRKRKAIKAKVGDSWQLDELEEPDNLDYDAPPGFSSVLEHKHSGDASYEDPDVPPGFG
ncbi:hypothetical protein SASPL_140730 [Salvia splendens]|uniref:BOD1/SHG1 domain-containing protein n=1 Tax=Salvia splendens TaxID=180675 RepID=A0A8X8ZCR4_SALSN|nr:uncharacterized protein LOC121768065 isoform X1 [Salvia splendens]XP_042020341.1 uncharacterized protein LOC121768065 isoform X1 [Salvia splendens]XP_042020342.1 uncharacterized protein LOC121768065 isoform X1 [Salvia splendens]KAG6399254.1 hypothetical protein SASPL_140730 [Salvia splendens]